MTALDLDRAAAVAGTGTMGQGTARVALVAGHPVRLYDAVPGRAREAVDAIGARPAGTTPGHVVVGEPAEPAAELPALIREAGIEVRAGDVEGPSGMLLPSGGRVFLADGRTASESGAAVRFDLALDYRRATRVALAPSASASGGPLSEAHRRDPSGRYAPSLALRRHAHAGRAGEGEAA